MIYSINNGGTQPSAFISTQDFFANLHPKRIITPALNSFTKMIRRQYENGSIRILLSQGEIRLKNEVLLGVTAGEGEPEIAVG